MQQLLVVGYQPPHHYYSLLSAAARPTVLHAHRSPNEQPSADMMHWMFPATPVLYDEKFQHEHRMLDHELKVQPVERRPADRPNHFVLTGANGLFSYCTSQLFYVSC